MPSNLLKSSPVDTSPPVVILPPHIVELEVDGVSEQIDVHSELPCVDKEEYEVKYSGSQHVNREGVRCLEEDLKTPSSSQQPEVSCSSGATAGKTGRRGKVPNRSLKRLQNSQQQDGSKNGETPRPGASSRKSLKHQQSKEEKKLPEALVKISDTYLLSDAPPRPNAYIRYIERTPEELSEIVEYDLDEEDLAWLELLNKSREGENLTPISPNCMEEIMDKLEKESFYQSSVLDQGSLIDDDAVCCICMDGECQNANAILFCDMCNLAVHQECYGVPYIPEGQWLCRRCFFSPSRPVECVLCPNSGGAFKQTECKRWAHVVCAIWIPEVCFANTVFLEPIDNINTIPPARWRLTCFICKQKNRGACIQCIKNNCYTAFHVTCAQQAGLCMRMDPDSERGVKKKAWCPTHAPADFIAERETDSSTEHQRLKHVRKMLAEKRCAPPMVLLPTISADKIAQISSRFNFRRKDTFMSRVMAYWKLKRSSRNGVPLLRRLQITNTTSAACKSSRKGDVPEAEHSKQNYADTLRVRQDLEKGRLLCELTRKREKTKREYIYTTCQEWDMRIQPFNFFLNSIIDDLVVKDTQSIFTQPVDPELVPDYLTVIKKPMDLSTMRTKIFEFEYETIDDLQADFELMINNCMQYNSKDTLFYRAASRMQELGGIVFREAKRAYDRIGFLPGGVMSQTPPPQYYAKPEIVDDGTLGEEIEDVLESRERHDLAFEEHLRLLQDIFDKSLNLSNVSTRKKKFIRIKKEIYKLKKKQRQDDEGEEESISGARDLSSMDEDETALSLFGGDAVESSDIGEDGRESGASSSRYSNIRRRLRSTDHNEQHQQRHPHQTQSQQTLPNKALLTSPRLSRRLSRSSESVVSVLTPLASAVPSSAAAASVKVRSTALAQSPSSSVSSRPRGRPPKSLSQQQRGRGASKVRASIHGGSISPVRQSTSVSSAARAHRGGLRGRPSKARRNLRRPLRRSARVDNLQKQAQGQHSSNSPGKDLSGSSRHASPGGRSISPPKSSRSSRNVSPTLASASKSQQSPAPSSSAKSIQINKGRPSTNRAFSPVISSPLKPDQEWMIEAALKRRAEALNNASQRSPTALQVFANMRIPTTTSPEIDATVRPRGRGRPPRKSAVKLLNNSNNNNSAFSGATSRADSGSSKSMEATAKSVVCDDRLSSPRAGRQQHQHHHSANKTSRRRIIMDVEEDEGVEQEDESFSSPSRLGGGAGAITPVVRRNSVTRCSALLQNLKAARHSTAGNTSPVRKLKGPAGAVGRRKKSINSDLNGPLVNSPAQGRPETSVLEKRKSMTGGHPLNGISPMSPVRHPVSSLHNHPSSVKKRPRRSAAVSAAKSIYSANSNVSHHHNNNSLVSGSSGGSLHHHHHHPHHSPRKMDSFSVYRSGGDHDINSYSEAEDDLSDDEVEEEEDDEDEEDEDEDEEEEEDDDEDEEEEEEEEEGVCSSLPQEEEDSDDEDDDNQEETEDSSGNEGLLEKPEDEEVDDPDEDQEAEDQEDDEEVGERDEELEELNEETDEKDVTNEASRPNDSSGSDNSSDSDEDSDSSSTSSSTLSTTSAASNRSKESSSSSITTPRHLHPSAKRMKVVRRRRSSSRHRRPQPAILSKLSSTTPSPRSRPMPARSNPNFSPDITHLVTHNNNNNVLYNNKEKDKRERDNVSTSSSDGVSSSVGQTVNRRDSVTTAALNSTSHQRTTHD